MVCFRYLPQHNSTNRFGYQPSAELMQWLTPRRRWVSSPNHPLILTSSSPHPHSIILTSSSQSHPHLILTASSSPHPRREILTDLNHPWGLETPANLRGRFSPRASTRQPGEGEELEPTWLLERAGGDVARL